ncbi:MAG: response regulator, partial [Deltaproteobacteria bacterium]|nr:response regulator [Deltaproteobacteria bacterium]
LRRFASVRAAMDELALVEREVSEAQRAIADAATELASALDRLPDGVALVRDDRILVANRALGEFVGIVPADLVGRSLAGALSPRAPRPFAELFTAGRAATAAVLVTVEGRDSPPRVLECLPPLPLAHQGTPARLFVFRDVTEQLATEARLRASEATNRALVEALPHTLVRVRRSGEVVQAVSGRATLPYLPAAALVGQRVQELEGVPGVAPEAVAAGRAVTAVVLDDGVPRTFELDIGVGESRAVFECDISRFDRDEALVVVRDVTERRRLTAQIGATDRLASLGTLAAGVAHEINNPLTYVLANLGDLLVRFRSDQAVGERELPGLTALAEEAFSGAERVAHIVRDLRPFARGPADDTTALVSVEQVLDAMTSIAGNEIRHRAALVKDYGGVPAVEGSEARLGQVFLNLLVNAAQAIPVGAADRNTITVRTSAAAGEVRVDVEDSGAGMPPEVVSRIFDPFFTTKPRGEGTGLGLTICRDIVQRLGGRMEAESEVGRGTRFSVWLRAGAQRVESRPQTAPPDSAPPQVARVLIVDDDPPVGRALARVLRAHDVRVTRSGEEALEVLAADRSWDVIFCDLMMPIVSGIDVHARVRALYPELLPAFVFMTGGA